jgi:flagellar biosynthetic protein FliR
VLLDHLPHAVSYVLVVSIRMGVALALLPAPIGQGAPVVVRAALGVYLALALTWAHLADLPPEVTDPTWVLTAALGEAWIGASIGLTARLAVAVAEIAGELVSTSMGLGFAPAVDPNTGHESTATSLVLAQLTTLAFFAIRGHHVILTALASTLDLLPPGAGWRLEVATPALELAGSILRAGVLVASPVVATMFIVQLGVALASRVASRLQVFSLSFAVAASVGLLTLGVVLPAIAGALVRAVEGLGESLAALVTP